ncbi:hypothetical protein J6590_042419 [Homalodisca vitripennis]|nr:hypothetical protein J6590_042419 [Homalodisca vitripennis]
MSTAAYVKCPLPPIYFSFGSFFVFTFRALSQLVEADQVCCPLNSAGLQQSPIVPKKPLLTEDTNLELAFLVGGAERLSSRELRAIEVDLFCLKYKLNIVPYTISAPYRTDCTYDINKRRLQGSGPLTLSISLPQGCYGVNLHPKILGSRLGLQLDIAHLQGNTVEILLFVMSTISVLLMARDRLWPCMHLWTLAITRLSSSVAKISRCNQRSNVCGIANKESSGILKIGPKIHILWSFGSDGDSTFSGIIQQDAIRQVRLNDSQEINRKVCSSAHCMSLHLAELKAFFTSIITRRTRRCDQWLWSSALHTACTTSWMVSIVNRAVVVTSYLQRRSLSIHKGRNEEVPGAALALGIMTRRATFHAEGYAIEAERSSVTERSGSGGKLIFSKIWEGYNISKLVPLVEIRYLASGLQLCSPYPTGYHIIDILTQLFPTPDFNPVFGSTETPLTALALKSPQTMALSVETHTPHPNETITRAGYQDRYLSEKALRTTQVSDGAPLSSTKSEPHSEANRYNRLPELLERLFINLPATRSRRKSHLFALQADFQTQDARLSGGACTALVVLATALVADTTPVTTAAAISYMIKT